MKKDVQKRLLIVGGVIGLGVVAYVLYDRYQNGGGPTIAPGPTPQPLPQKSTTTTTTKPAPTPGQIQAYKDAVANLDKWNAWVAANRPTNQAELDAMVAKSEEFKAAVRATAAVIGVSPGV
jgi:hypothetical protein